MLCRRAKIKANCWYGRWVHGGLAVLLVMRVSLPSSSFPFPFFVVVVVVVSNDPRDFFFFFLVKCVIDTWARTHRCVGPVSWPAHIGPLSSSSQVVRSLVFSFVFFFCSFVYLFFSLLAETTIERKTCAVSLLDVHLCLQRRHDVPRTWPVSFRVVWLRAKKKQNKKKSSYSMLFVCFFFCLFSDDVVVGCPSFCLFLFHSFFFVIDWYVQEKKKKNPAVSVCGFHMEQQVMSSL